MKLKNKILVLSLFLVLLCCLGAVSATEDINETITTDSSLDNVNTVEDTVDEIMSDDSDNSEKIVENQDIKKTNMLTTSGTQVNAATWAKLEEYAEDDEDDYIIKLTGTNYAADSQIIFGNSATIIGTSNSYITAGSYTGTPFINTNSALTITFINVTFRDMSVTNLLELAGTNNLENCNFYNIVAGTGHNAVIYNTDGTMNLINCNVINSSAGYGVVSNYKSGTYTGVVMNVNDCTFINNSANVEPGAINNCGILNVDNSEFINNTAAWWAGAIHTHYNAQTIINNSLFEGNVAGWNGGALYTYSTLKVYNSIFKRNKCNTNIGGGAIGASRWWNGNYDITIVNCTFEENENCNTNGNGGAITAMNSGALNVHDSTFINNTAKNGQAIAAFSQAFENITAGIPNLKVYNNTFYNHTLTTSDTVEISGNYTFENNTFVNCYQTNLGTNNIFINPVTLNNNNLIFKSNKETLLMSSSSENILKEDAPSVIYVNVNLDGNDPDEGDCGYDWETAYGTKFGITRAISRIAEGGIIYLADGDYSNRQFNDGKNITFIGQSNETQLSFYTTIWAAGAPNATYTFINMTIYHGVSKKGVNYNNYERNMNFINCSIVGDITIEKEFNTGRDETHIEETEYARTYFINFDNCVFKNINVENAVVTLYNYGYVKFTNCNFENITADSIVSKNGTFKYDDGVYFYDCKFNNCNVKGIVAIPETIDIETYCVIEDGDYDFDATLNVETYENYNYVNATKLKVVAVETNITVTSSENNVVITLKDVDGNPIANADVIYTIGTTNTTATTIADGTATIPNLKGIVNITVNYLGNDSYLPSTNSGNFVFKYATVISSEVSGSNIIITLKDDENKALANTNVTYTINGAETTKATDANGTITLSGLKGVVAITAKYAGDDLHTESNTADNYTFKYDTALTAPKVSATYNVAKNLVITLKDETGKAIEGRYVTVKVGTISKNIKTDKNGQVSVNVATLTPKTYTASISFAGDTLYNAKSIKANVVVAKATPKLTAKKATFKVKKTKKYSVTLKDNKGKAINKVKVTIKVNGKTYSATTKNGKATFKLTKLTKKGTYKATIKFAGNSLYKAVTKKSVKIVVKK